MNIHKIAGLVFFLAVLLLTVAQSQAFDPTDYPSFGNVGVEEYQPLGVEEVAEGGTLVFVATTPGGQAAEVNLTGPDGIKVDFELEVDGETVLEELPLGIYSVAATDESMQLAEGKVEVRSGQRGFVSIELIPIPDFEYDLADYGPYGDFQVGTYEALEETDGTGSLIITTNLPDEAELNVTGPNGYKRDFIGNVILTNLTLSDLDPGPYSIAATAEGYALTEGKVEVRAGEVVAIKLILEPLGEAGTEVGEQDEPIVIRLGEHSITKRDFDHMFSIAARNMAVHQGMPLNAEMLAQFESFRPAFLEQLATQVALLDEAKRRGISVSEEEVEARMQVVRQSFENDEAFQRFLEDAGFSDEAQLREAIRDLETVRRTLEGLSEGIEVSDEEIQSFYDENQERIGQPLENVREQVRQALVRERVKERITELREGSGVEVFPESLSLLEPGSTGNPGATERGTTSESQSE